MSDILIRGMEMPKEPIVIILFPDGKLSTEDYDIGANAHAYEVPEYGRLDERLTPKKPKVSVDTWVCPVCGRDVEFQAMLGENILFHGMHDFCPNCGQAIDWTEPPKEET